MNRDQFFDKHRNLNIQRTELERKYRVLLREQEEARMMQQMILAKTTGGAGQSGPTPSNENVTGSASIHFFVNESGNIAFVVMNYTLGILSDIYDTNIAYDSGASFISNEYTNVHDGGFQVRINDSPNSRQHVFFVNNVGEVVDQIYTGGGYNDAQLEMFLTFFADYEPDGAPTYTILKLFDGYSTTTLEIDGVTSLNWQSQPTSQKVAVFEYNSEFHLIGMNGQNVKIHDTTPSANLDIRSQYTHSYVCGTIYDTTDNNFIKRFKAWNSDGTVIADVDISAYNVDLTWDSELYGDDNRYCGVFYNGGDGDVDYLVIHFDGENVVIDTHERGANYPNVSVYTTDLEKWNPSNSMKNNAVIVFYKDGTHFTAPGFSSAEYFDVWCMHHSLSAFTKENLITTAEIGYRISSNQEEGAIYSGDPVFLYYDLADEPVDVIVGTFNSSGFNSFGLGIDPEDIDSLSSIESIAPNFAFFNTVLNSDNTTRIWKIFNSTGTVVTHSTSTSTDFGGGPMYDALVVLDLSDFANSFSFSPAQGKQLLPDPGADTYDILAYNEIENEFGTSSGYSTRNVIVTKYTLGNLTGFYIYNDASGASDLVLLPSYQNLENFLMGETIVYFAYFDEDDKFHAIIYDITNGSTLASLDAEVTSFDLNGSQQYGDRIWKSFGVGGNTEIYFLCRGGTFIASLGNNVLGHAYNDAYWINND